MAKKYKHILLPATYVGSQSNRIDNQSRRLIENLPDLTEDENSERKERISAGLSNVSAQDNYREKRIESDKAYHDVKLRFRGVKNTKLLEKYNIEIYQQSSLFDDALKSDLVIGKIRSARLRGEVRSDFEKFRDDFAHYSETSELKSYFDKLDDIKRLTFEELAEDHVQQELQDSPDEGHILDFSFGGKSDEINIKFDDIKARLSEEKFLTKINLDSVHYCRLKVSLSEARKIASSYNGIVSIDTPPIVEFSRVENHEDEDIVVIDQTNDSAKPIFVFDSPLASDHKLLQNAVVDAFGDQDVHANVFHGTSVASLVICGGKIRKHGEVTQRNKVIGVNILNESKVLNDRGIVDVIESYSSEDKPLIANISMNMTLQEKKPYVRHSVYRLTKVLDELSNKHNCIFVISAGNIGLGKGYAEKVVDEDKLRDIYSNEYPALFEDAYTGIVPPADSINNITVGSITYAATEDSMVPATHPSVITRRGLGRAQNGTIKPDFVEYDSNHTLPSEGIPISEDNGPWMADWPTGITRNAGTSFSAPLTSFSLGILSQAYPSYNSDTLRALLVNFASPINAVKISDPELESALMGFGKPNLEASLVSLSSASTIVIEDEIGVEKIKRIKVPIPASLAGSHRKRLRISRTLVYSPPIDPLNPLSYSQLSLKCNLFNEAGSKVDNGSTQDMIKGAHSRSNVKKYPIIEKRTTDHVGDFWEIEVACESHSDEISKELKQKFSIVLTIEDIMKDTEIDIHEDICNMIGVEVNIESEIQVEAT